MLNLKMLPNLRLLFSVFLAGLALAKVLTPDVITEEEAKKKLEPQMGTVKKIDSADIEHLVIKGWWDLANEIVVKSHEQNADLSFAIRKGVKEVRRRADEVIRSLNPNYNEKKQVIPVFRWAQNDTSIFLTIKYSVKWDAPGAVNVKDPTVTMTDSMFSFKAFGEHSGNKYEYTLDLDCFDYIDEKESSWSSASVGRFTAIIAKKRSRKWPRLLLDKKKKGTGRLDLTRQEEMDKNQMNGATTVSHSERTCAALKKVYCPSKDNCHEDCSTCTDRTSLKDNKYCSGPPQKPVASVLFTDTNMERGIVSGEVKIEQVRTEYDVKHYLILYGKMKKTESERKLDNMTLIAKVPADLRLKEMKWDLPDQKVAKDLDETEQMALAVITENDFGSLRENSPVYRVFDDAYLPEKGPTGASFHDTDGEIGKIKGDVVITSEEDPTTEEFALYWGKKSARKLSTDAYIGTTRPSVPYKLDSRSIPNGATHILVFSKNKHGENTNSLTMAPIVDSQKPCAGKDRNSSLNCPPSVKGVSEDLNPKGNLVTLDIHLDKPKKKLAKSVHYQVYASTGDRCDGESNYRHLENVTEEAQGDGTTKLKLVDTVLNPEGESWRYTHLQVFSENEYGTGKYCSSVKFVDAGKDEGEDEKEEQKNPEL